MQSLMNFHHCLFKILTLCLPNGPFWPHLYTPLSAEWTILGPILSGAVVSIYRRETLIFGIFMKKSYSNINFVILFFSRNNCKNNTYSLFLSMNPKPKNQDFVRLKDKLKKVLYEPPHAKTNKMACAPREDSDRPGHPPSLIRVFAVRSMGS